MYYLFQENLHLGTGNVCYSMFTVLFTIQLVLQMIHLINEHIHEHKDTRNF